MGSGLNDSPNVRFIPEETHLALTRLRDELAAYDPDVLSLDLNDPDMAISLFIVAAVLRGKKIDIVKTDKNGRTETLSFHPLDSDDSGNPNSELAFSSPDDTLSPFTAEIVALILQPQLDAEISQLFTQE